MRVRTAQTRRTAALTPTGSTAVRDLSRRISHEDFQIVAIAPVTILALADTNLGTNPGSYLIVKRNRLSFGDFNRD